MDTQAVVKIVEARRAELDLIDEVVGTSETTRKFAAARETEAEKVRDALQMFSLSNADAPREDIVGVIEKRRAALQAELDATPAPSPIYSKHAKLQVEIDTCNELISLVPVEEPAPTPEKTARKR